MEELGYDIIDIDGVLYSKTGFVSKISFERNDLDFMDTICTSMVFTNSDDIKAYISKVYGIKNDKINIIKYSNYQVKNLTDIPSIYKSKDDGEIEVKDSNKILTLIAKKISKSSN